MSHSVAVTVRSRHSVKMAAVAMHHMRNMMSFLKIKVRKLILPGTPK